MYKIFALLLIFCAILLTVLWLLQTVFLETTYRYIKTQEIKNNAHYINRLIQEMNIKDAEPIIKSAAENGEYYAEIIDINDKNLRILTNKTNFIHVIDRKRLIEETIKNGGVYIEYPSFKDGNDFSPSANHFQSQFEMIPPSLLDKVPPNFRKMPPNQRSLVYVKQINLNNEECFLILSAVISPVNATITTLRSQLYVITIIMIILSIALAFFIARFISKPIEEMNKNAKVLAQGDYSTRFSEKGYLEIAELSQTLNTAATELDKVEKMRRELLANVSHDLRTPLSVIYGYAEIMHDFPSEITQEQPQIIMEEASRLTTLVNDMLDISKLESGAENLSMSRINISALIKEIGLRTIKMIEKEGYSIEFDLDDKVFVLADEVKITQVFYNLLVNAINYTGNDKKISVRQKNKDKIVKIEIKDTGDGISEELIPHIWERYYRADKNHKRPITGTGLGLSIVKKIITLHGGECGVISKPQQGSIFWFSLKTID